MGSVADSLLLLLLAVTLAVSQTAVSGFYCHSHRQLNRVGPAPNCCCVNDADGTNHPDSPHLENIKQQKMKRKLNSKEGSRGEGGKKVSFLAVSQRCCCLGLKIFYLG